VDLLALRGGALLAWDWLRDAQVAVERLILWQPVVSGRQLAAQLLRLRLARQGWLEIAGYGFASGLFAALKDAALGPIEGHRFTAVDWFQVGSSPNQPLPPQLQNILEDWRAAGLAVADPQGPWRPLLGDPGDRGGHPGAAPA
jgi:hypothetical protein